MRKRSFSLFYLGREYSQIISFCASHPLVARFHLYSYDLFSFNKVDLKYWLSWIFLLLLILNPHPFVLDSDLSLLIKLLSFLRKSNYQYQSYLHFHLLRPCLFYLEIFHVLSHFHSRLFYLQLMLLI